MLVMTGMAGPRSFMHARASFLFRGPLPTVVRLEIQDLYCKIFEWNYDLRLKNENLLMS